MAQTSNNTRLYAVGDIHGRADLLLKLHKKIAADSANFSGVKKIIYLGDYVDRGTTSRQVLDILTTSPLDNFESIFLMGNHEYAMMDFIKNPSKDMPWIMRWGGDATVRNYGIPLGQTSKAKKISSLLKKAVPNSHKEFLGTLITCHIEGDYLFVHAGVRPNVPIKEQKLIDLLLIRDDFIGIPHNLPYTVVFGHTVVKNPIIEKDKIGIDTGAYLGESLTAVVLEGKNIKFISVS